MRLLKISAPAGSGTLVRDTAFAVGIESVSIHTVTSYLADGRVEEKEVVDLDLPTPLANKFMNALLAADYFDRDRYTVESRQALTLLTKQKIRDITHPLPLPATDVFEELWQFSHITYGLVGRMFIGGCLLSFGLVESKILMIITGLLFLPVLPLVSAIAYGVTGRQFALAKQGAASLLITLVLLFIAGVLVALFSNGPIKFTDLGSPWVGVMISVGVGIAATLATIDDAGRRELIGLAAASQIAIIPAWMGAAAILGLPVELSMRDVLVELAEFGCNLIVLTLTLMIVQKATGIIGEIRRVR